jgi:hypothetical protein
VKILRAVLLVLGLLALPVLYLVTSHYWTPDPWVFPKDSLRFIGYNYIVVAHRGLIAGLSVAYLVLVVFAYKKEASNCWNAKAASAAGKSFFYSVSG